MCELVHVTGEWELLFQVSMNILLGYHITWFDMYDRLKRLLPLQTRSGNQNITVCVVE